MKIPQKFVLHKSDHILMVSTLYVTRVPRKPVPSLTNHLSECYLRSIYIPRFVSNSFAHFVFKLTLLKLVITDCRNEINHNCLPTLKLQIPYLKRGNNSAHTSCTYICFAVQVGNSSHGLVRFLWLVFNPRHYAFFNNRCGSAFHIVSKVC